MKCRETWRTEDQDPSLGCCIIHVLRVSVALVIQHAVRMRRIILLSVACLALPHFPTLSHTGHEFREKKILKIKCLFWCVYKIAWNISHSKKNWARYYHIIIKSSDFRKILKSQISWKSLQWDPSFSVRTDRQIDIMKVIAAFRNFANTFKPLCYFKVGHPRCVSTTM